MKEIRFHGRGGQGAVTAAELVAQAAISSDLHAQGFPNFGAERRGAPVMAFLRVSGERIYLRERIDKPDIVVVLDSTLIGLPEVTSGLALGKTMVINASIDQVSRLDALRERYRIWLVDATQIAVDTIGIPITNTAIIGALVRASGLVTLDSMNESFERRFGKIAAKNLAAMRTAYERTALLDDRVIPDGGPVPAEDDYETYIAGEGYAPWRDVPLGCDVDSPGSTRSFHTGNWRTGRYPVMDEGKCIQCGICWLMCPEMAFTPEEDGSYCWSGDYCKGCGICATTCPKKALSMEEDQ